MIIDISILCQFFIAEVQSISCKFLPIVNSEVQKETFRMLTELNHVVWRLDWSISSLSPFSDCMRQIMNMTLGIHFKYL